ncbi:MAG: caspase family protein, partial [Polyangiaceae bacterium]|nr:caspase family protein [Polyangiaceae bacterium]
MATSGDAFAQDATLPTTPHPRAYAVIIGANQGGQGQEPLRYAEDDAVRFAAVLRELGQHESPELRILLHPTGREVVATIDDVAQKLRGHKERGEQAVFYFYYSGHARAAALNLGAEEVSVALLRERLSQLPQQRHR